MARFRLHERQLAPHVVLDTFQLLAVVAPCHHIAVRPYRGQPLAVGLVQIFLYPFTVYLVGAAVTRQRVHVAGGLLELAQVLGRVVDEQVLVHDMVAGHQYTYGCGERQAAVAAVGGETLVARIRCDA